jgi:hypothetical protein
MSSRLIYGVSDKDGVSRFLKASIYHQVTSETVIGYIGTGTTRQLQSNWQSPFEQANVGSLLSKTAGVLQTFIGATSITTFSSTQVWDGNRPLSFNLNLVFIAMSDPKNEVMEPLRLLEEFASPELKNLMPVDSDDVLVKLGKVFGGGGKEEDATGRIPGMVNLNIGDRMLIPDCVIENITTPLDKERDSNGNLLRAEVSLSIATKTMLNRDKGKEPTIHSIWR